MPPARVVPAHVKLVRLSERAMLLPAVPGVSAVTVTSAPLEVAVTPTAELRPLQAVITFARFVAKLVVLVLGANVPAVELEHAVELGAVIVVALNVMWLLERVNATELPVVLTR